MSIIDTISDLKKMIKAYNELSEEDRNNPVKGVALKIAMQKLSEDLKDKERSVGTTYGPGGDYNKTIDGL